MSERTTVLPRTIRADGQEENTGERTSQKYPNSFPSSGKGRVAVFDGPAILAMYSPLRSHTRFCDQPQTGCSPQLEVNWTGPHRLSLKHDSFRNSDQLSLPLWHRRERALIYLDHVATARQPSLWNAL